MTIAEQIRSKRKAIKAITATAESEGRQLSDLERTELTARENEIRRLQELKGLAEAFARPRGR
jgi:hypothetical protein